jgi:DNA-binding MarR family transcriptional regulator
MADHVQRVVDQWRRERPDLDVSAMEVLSRLWRFARRADAQVEGGFAEHGLQPGWFDVLASLRRAGKPYELTPTQLLETAMVSSGGMTKRLDRLAEAGLIERRPDHDDRRGVRIRLTRAGLRAVDRAVEAHVEREHELLAPLTPREREQLDRLLRKLLSGVEDRTRPAG